MLRLEDLRYGPKWLQELLAAKFPEQQFRAYALFRHYPAEHPFSSPATSDIFRDRTIEYKRAVAGIAGVGVGKVEELCFTGKQLRDETQGQFEPVGAQFAHTFKILFG